MTDKNETYRSRSSWRDLFRAIGEAGAVTGVVDPDPDWSIPAPVHRVRRNDSEDQGGPEGRSSSGRDVTPAKKAEAGNPVVRSPCFQCSAEEEDLDLGHYEDAA